MSLAVPTPVPLVPLAADATQPGFRLPLGVRICARFGGHPFLVQAEATAPALTLAILDARGALLARVRVATAGLAGIWLPPGAARLVPETPTTEPVCLSHAPLGRAYHLWRAFRQAGSLRQVGKAARSARPQRGPRKRLLWVSPAATPLGLATYRRFRRCHVGDFTAVVAANAAPAVHFVSQAADVPLERLTACAAALREQNDSTFSWYVGVPAVRMRRGGDAIRSLLSNAILVETEAAAPAACLAMALAAALDADGDGLIVPLDAQGHPTRDAVALLRASLAGHPDGALLYTDEDYVDDRGQPVDAAFKPAFNRHLLWAMNYPGHLVGLGAPRLREIGGLRPEFGAAALYDLVLRYSASIASSRILHVPRVAYSCPAGGPGFADEPTARLAAQALSQHLGVPVDVVAGGRHLRPHFPVPSPAPLVSIIIPTRDRAALLRTTVESLLARTAYTRYELILVDNGSVEPETLALFEEIATRWPPTRVVRDDGDFNFSRLCNAGIAVADGDLLLLLNNDMEIIEPHWLDEMVSLAILPETGIVGAKLLYPDRTVQHAGFMIGVRSGAGSHWFAHAAADAAGYQERLLVRQNLSAVTGACLMIRRDCLEDVGLLDEIQFPEECNDVDLCLRARRAGYEVVFTPFACLIHHESASRGADNAQRSSPSRLAERTRFEQIWAVTARIDPHYSPNLERDNEFALRAPAPRGPREPRTDAI